MSQLAVQLSLSRTVFTAERGQLLPHGYTLSTHRARLDHVLGFLRAALSHTRFPSSPPTAVVCTNYQDVSC